MTDDGTIAYEMAERKPPARLVTRISDPKLPFGGSWIYEISATPEGCRLNITERESEVYNPIFRFVTRFFLGYNRASTNMLHEHLEMLPSLQKERQRTRRLAEVSRDMNNPTKFVVILAMCCLARKSRRWGAMNAVDFDGHFCRT